MTAHAQLLTDLQAKQRKFSKRKAKRNRKYTSKTKKRKHKNHSLQLNIHKGSGLMSDPYYDENAYMNAYPSNIIDLARGERLDDYQ